MTPGRNVSISTSAPSAIVSGQRGVTGVVEVEHHRLLATPDHRERRQVSERTAPGRLDVHHLGSEVGQRLAGLCPGETVGQIEDAQARERPSGLRRGIVLHQHLPRVGLSE